VHFQSKKAASSGPFSAKSLFLREIISADCLKCGGRGGIRTHGCFHIGGFQDRCNRPLCHPSAIGVQGRGPELRGCTSCATGLVRTPGPTRLNPPWLILKGARSWAFARPRAFPLTVPLALSSGRAKLYGARGRRPHGGQRSSAAADCVGSRG
jgi:hypothetical protein